MSHYLGVCIPYRDTGDGVRKGHLDKLVPYLTKYLDERNIKHKIFIGHQVHHLRTRGNTNPQY